MFGQFTLGQPLSDYKMTKPIFYHQMNVSSTLVGFINDKVNFFFKDNVSTILNSYNFN